MFIFPPQKYFSQSHASTLTQLDDGRILAAWFAGTRETHPDTAIWMSCLEPGDKEWSPPHVVAKISDTAHWNPVLFNCDKKTYLYFKVGQRISSWVTYVMEFDGNKWSDLKELVAGQINRGPVRSKPIVLSNGDWIAPSSVEQTINYNMFSPNDVIWKAFVDISCDCGKTWEKSGLIDFNRTKFGIHGKYGGVIQPCLWESSNGNVHMLLRSTAGYVFKSDSCDYGRTWSDAYPTKFFNNNSAIDVVKKSDNLLVLALNPVSGNWAARTPLSVYLLIGDEKDWNDEYYHDLESEQGSYCYPSLTVLNDGSVGMTYTWNRVSIQFKIIKKEKFDYFL